MQNLTKNDKAWELIFEAYPIIDEINHDGSSLITADQIRCFREPRLMTKFDHAKNLPEIFKKYQLNILPVSRGSYIIGRFENYHKLEKSFERIHFIQMPIILESLDIENIFSEAMAMNVAYITGILQDFSGEAILYTTVNGRMSSADFDFELSEESIVKHIQVESAQVEIDGGFEGEHSILIIEAKNTLSSDFLIRQLYYPFRLWQTKCRKKVRPIFMVYSNGLFYLYEYQFTDYKNYHAIKLVKHKRYSIIEKAMSRSDIVSLINAIYIEEEPRDCPFPQADNFQRLISLCEILYQAEKLYKSEITVMYDFDVRQTEYYTNAAAYLKLIESVRDTEETFYRLTPQGRLLFELKLYERNVELIKRMLRHEVFMKVLVGEFSENKRYNRNEIAQIMKTSTIYGVRGESTYLRRASTIRGWLNYIYDLIERG